GATVGTSPPVAAGAAGSSSSGSSGSSSRRSRIVRNLKRMAIPGALPALVRGGSLCAAAPRREMLTNTLPGADNANRRSQSLLPPAVLDPARVRDVARRHGLDAIRWWPPNQGDLLVEGLPVSLRSLRAELERALGCRVAIYLADCPAEETR